MLVGLYPGINGYVQVQESYSQPETRVRKLNPFSEKVQLCSLVMPFSEKVQLHSLVMPCNFQDRLFDSELQTRAITQSSK